MATEQVKKEQRTSQETLAPMLTGLGNYTAGPLPPVATGLALSRKGVTVTAFGPNPDGDGTLLRVWELAGGSGDLTVTLPAGTSFTSATPVTLRGETTGALLPLGDGRLVFPLHAYAPASFVLK